jgi:hypothetical protein
MLALSNKDGVISSSIPGLADMARVSIADCEKALEEFTLPDSYSRTSEHDGRRIEVLDGVGWRLLNHAKYRDDPASRMQTADAKTGKIYFIQCNDAIKIGFSQNPWARLATLKTAMPDNPILLGSFNGVFQDEIDLHARFKHLRINREWFKAEPELLEHISALIPSSVANGSNYAATTMNYNNTDTDTDTEEDTEKRKDAALPPVDPKKEMIETVFTFWQVTLGHTKAHLTVERRKKISERLVAGYSVEDIQTAILGCKASPHHQGQNDQGKIYDDLELICRSDTQLEKFIGYTREVKTNGTNRQNNTGNGRQTSADRIRDTASIYDKYPSETDAEA